MKCAMNEKKTMQIMLLLGVALMIIGGVVGYLLPEEAHLLVRMSGFVLGLGLAFVLMAGVVLIRRRIIGEKRAADAQLEALDERGQIIAGRAQNVLALCATFSLILIIVVALVRNDMLYMLLTAACCLACGIAKFVAAHYYGKRM